MVSEDVSNDADAQKMLAGFPAKCRHLLFGFACLGQ